MKGRSPRGLHGQLLAALGERIVGGEWQPGMIVDVIALEERFGVSRTTVREVLKSLAEKGLIGARPKVGTFVLPREDWNFLDSDVMTWRSAGPMDVGFAERIAEIRFILEPGAARLAALHHTQDDAEELRAAFLAMSESSDGPVDVIAEADLRFHRAVLLATHNEFLRGFEVVLEPILMVRNRLALSTPHDSQFLSLHEEVMEAILARDGARAERASDALLEEAAEDVLTALGEVGALPDRSQRRGAPSEQLTHSASRSREST